MLLHFGDGKISIIGGVNKDCKGLVKFEKLWEPWTIESGTYDSPIILEFENATSVETVIEMLFYVRDKMLEGKKVR